VPRRWWVAPLLLGAGVGLCFAVMAVLLLARGDSGSSRDVANVARTGPGWGPGERPAPDFRLRDQRGRRVSLASFRGRPVVLAFLDSHCGKLCPVEGRQLSDLADGLPPGARPAVVAVSVNPRDTPASARRAAGRWGWANLRWSWLLGSHGELAPVWRAYSIFVRPTAGDIQHTSALYLIDGRGDIRSAYTVPVATASLLHDVRTIESS
jgi:protein SCO1